MDIMRVKRRGTACVYVFVRVYGGSEAGVRAIISGTRVKPALMDKNKTLHADTL